MKKLICTFMSLAVALCLASCKSETDKTSDTENSYVESVTQSEVSTESTLEETYVATIDMPIEIVESNLIYAWGEVVYNEYLMKGDSTERNKEIGILNYAYLEMGEIGEIVDGKVNDNYQFKTEIFIVELDVKSDLYRSLAVGKDLRFYLDGGGSETFQITAINAQYVLGIRVSEQREEVKITETQPVFNLRNMQKVYEAFIGLE